MKLKFIIISAIFALSAFNANAEDAGLRYINSRGKVLCGTNLSYGTFVQKDQDGYYRGFEADLCRAFAAAIFGNTNRFEMVDISKIDNLEKAFKTGKVDIVLSSHTYAASEEIKANILPVREIYYDTQMFLAYKKDGAVSMKAYEGANVCVAANSEEFLNLERFSVTHQLNFNILNFKGFLKAKEAFMLKRCTLLAGGEIALRSVAKQYLNPESSITLLPEQIAIMPVYAFTAKDNITFNIVSKWIINAIIRAEENGITSKNVSIYIGVKDAEIKNLLGEDAKLWNKFNLSPKWLKDSVQNVGNYGEIYDNNFGKNSELNIERDKNLLLNNGGLIKSQPFL